MITYGIKLYRRVTGILYTLYNNFKQSQLSRFRMGVNVILTHKDRFVKYIKTVCLMCTEHEYDIHILFQCPVYHDLYVEYLSPFHSPPNKVSFHSLLQMEDLNMNTGLSL